MDNKIKEQILRVRETGLTNMFDTSIVQRIAHDMEFLNWLFILKITARSM